MLLDRENVSYEGKLKFKYRFFKFFKNNTYSKKLRLFI